MTLKTQLVSQIREGKMKAIVQSGEKKSPELPNVPLVNEMFSNPGDRQVAQLIDSGTVLGWSLLLPPGVAGYRVGAWRSGLAKMMTDPTLQARAKQAKADLSYKSGQEISAFVTKVLSTDPKVFARARKLVGIKK